MAIERADVASVRQGNLLHFPEPLGPSRTLCGHRVLESFVATNIPEDVVHKKCMAELLALSNVGYNRKGKRAEATRRRVGMVERAELAERGAGAGGRGLMARCRNCARPYVFGYRRARRQPGDGPAFRVNVRVPCLSFTGTWRDRPGPGDSGYADLWKPRGRTRAAYLFACSQDCRDAILELVEEAQRREDGWEYLHRELISGADAEDPLCNPHLPLGCSEEAVAVAGAA